MCRGSSAEGKRNMFGAGLHRGALYATLFTCAFEFGSGALSTANQRQGMGLAAASCRFGGCPSSRRDLEESRPTSSAIS